MMRLFYNGYAFSTKAETLVYNPTLVLYFLKILQRTCEYPEEILDDNLVMDRNRIAYIAQVKGAESLITGALNEETPLLMPWLPSALNDWCGLRCKENKVMADYRCNQP